MKYWTGIGSRDTPPDVLQVMRDVGRVLTDMGWILRSGGAKGADTAFYLGCLDSSVWETNLPRIYLSWNGMSNGVDKLYHTPSKGLYDATKYTLWDRATEIAKGLHGAWEKLGRGGIAHHTRNVFQVLGDDLETKSRFLMCWAPTIGKEGHVKGGTGTAVKLALANDIKVINLFIPEDYAKVILFLKIHLVDPPV